jgi:hypothetical protein
MPTAGFLLNHLAKHDNRHRNSLRARFRLSCFSLGTIPGTVFARDHDSFQRVFCASRFRIPCLQSITICPTVDNGLSLATSIAVVSSLFANGCRPYTQAFTAESLLATRHKSAHSPIARFAFFGHVFFFLFRPPRLEFVPRRICKSRNARRLDNPPF